MRRLEGQTSGRRRGRERSASRRGGLPAIQQPRSQGPEAELCRGIEVGSCVNVLSQRLEPSILDGVGAAAPMPLGRPWAEFRMKLHLGQACEQRRSPAVGIRDESTAVRRRAEQRPSQSFWPQRGQVGRQRRGTPIRCTLPGNLGAVFEGGVEAGLRTIGNHECADLLELPCRAQIRRHGDEGGDQRAGEGGRDGVASEGERENAARMLAQR